MTEPATTREEWRRNWRVAAGAGLGVATGYAIFPSVSSLFVLPLATEFGWSRSEQSLAQNATLIAATISPAVGSLIDRLGSRRVALACMPALAACYIGLACIGPNIEFYYALMTLAVLIGTGTTGMVFSRPVVRAFARSRGVALAVSRLGIGLAGALLPMALFLVISELGWRAGYLMLSILALCVGLTAATVWLPRADGGTVASANVAFRPTGRMLVVVLAGAMTVGPVVGIMSQLQPIMIWKGFQPGFGAALISLLSSATIIGTLVTGALVDRIWAPLIACLMTLLAAMGSVLLVVAPSMAVVALAVTLVGLAQGAEIDLMGFIVARYFGIERFASVFGLATLGIGLASAASAIGFANCYDALNSYTPALLVSAACFVASALLYLALGAYPREDVVDTTQG